MGFGWYYDSAHGIKKITLARVEELINAGAYYI